MVETFVRLRFLARDETTRDLSSGLVQLEVAR
jgi:hypothetical protein